MSTGPVTLDRIGVAVPATRPKPEAAPAAPSAAPAKPAAARPFHSGFCGLGPVCRDQQGKCKGTFDNGPMAPIPTLRCACVCHPQTQVATTV